MYVTMGHMIGLHLPKFLSGTANALRYAGVQLILIVPILIIYNHFFISGYKKLFKGAPNMDSLIALGATASIIYGIFAMIRMTQGLNSGDFGLVDEYRHNLYFESAGMILTLVSFGKYLESYPHALGILLLHLKKCGYFFVFFLPFYHHLCYNYLVIQDILLYISNIWIHLHPLL